MSPLDPLEFIDTSELFEAQQSLQTRECELEYEKCMRTIEETYQQETARQMRLRLLLLENENDELHEQLVQNDDTIDSLTAGTERMQQTISDLETNLQEARTGLRMRSRDLEHLQAEIDSLNSASKNSTKLLTEKLALSRELSSLKPELDHLRSQAGTSQDLLAEKLSLERQLSTLQVELENEKRSTQRMLSKTSKGVGNSSTSDEVTETLRAENAKEKKDRQCAEKELSKAQSEWDNRKAVLEGRIEALKTKLRSTKELLKEARSELQKKQEDTTRSQKAAGSETVAKGRKRKAAPMAQDETIGTPDGIAGSRIGAAGKVMSRALTLPGDKSTFSITPFLNRTASLAPESPDPNISIAGSGAGEDADELSIHQEADDSVVRPVQLSPSTRGKIPGKTVEPHKEGQNHNILLPAKPAKGNTAARPKKASSLLEVVREEENEENETPVGDQQSVKLPSAAKMNFKKLEEDARVAEPTLEPKGKKRKLFKNGLAKTLFDEEEPGEILKPSANLFLSSNGIGNLTKASLGQPKTRTVGTAAGGFGQFSPRKKEKKALNRSLLQ